MEEGVDGVTGEEPPEAEEDPVRDVSEGFVETGGKR